MNIHAANNKCYLKERILDLHVQNDKRLWAAGIMKYIWLHNLQVQHDQKEMQQSIKHATLKGTRINKCTWMLKWTWICIERIIEEDTLTRYACSFEGLYIDEK